MENVSRSNCPVCLGDIHTSRYPCHIPDCGHLLHKTCFDQLVSAAQLNTQFCLGWSGHIMNSFHHDINSSFLFWRFIIQLASGHYVCPTCQTSMIDMTKLWDYLDTQAQNLPVPKSHENSIVDIFCNDCFKVSYMHRASFQKAYHFANGSSKVENSSNSNIFVVLFCLRIFSNQRWNSILLDWNVPIVADIIPPKT